MAYFTHNGWMLFCPIKLAGTYSECPHVEPRWAVLVPLFWLACEVQQIVIWLCSQFYEDYEPNFYFKVTGERRK